MSVVFNFPAGKILDNLVLKGTAAGAGIGNWTDETYNNIVVPAGKQWILHLAYGKPDVNATINISVYNSDDKLLFVMGAQGAGVSLIPFPDNGGAGELDGGVYPIPLKAGDYIKVLFGAQQAATAYTGAIVTEMDIS